MISDGRRIYLTGYSSITALQPINAKRLRAARLKLRREGKPPAIVLHRAAEAARLKAKNEGKGPAQRARAGREAVARVRLRHRRAAAAAGAGRPAQRTGKAASADGP